MAKKKTVTKDKNAPADVKTEPAAETKNGGALLRFFLYGAIWLCVFCTVSGGCRAARWVNEKRQLISLILHGDFGGFDLPNPVLPKGDGELARWIKKNLPDEKTDERPAVAAVFANVAGMLRRGELTGGRDAMAETIAQLQPVCTRRVWLGFLTKLGTTLAAQLKDASAEQVAAAFETVADAIGGGAQSLGSPLPAPSPTDGRTDSGDRAAGSLESPDPASAPDAETSPPRPESQEDRTAAGDCPTGNCPTNTGGGRYGYGYYGRGWWY